MNQTSFPTEHQHYIFTIDFRSNMVLCYINGELTGKSRTYFQARNLANDKLFIGRHPTNSRTGFIGSIREIKIHNKPIGKAKVQQFYQHGKN